MKCLICGEEINTPVYNITFRNYIIHYDCFDGLEPEIKFDATKPIEVRKQEKIERLKRIENKVIRIIEEKEKNHDL